MRIDLRDRHRNRLFSVEIDPKDPPAVVRDTFSTSPALDSSHSSSQGGSIPPKDRTGEAKTDEGRANKEQVGDGAVPSSDDGGEFHLKWDGALDDEGSLRRCPACGCREIFVRKDFPQRVGFAIVVTAAVVALILFSMEMMLLAFCVLGSMAVVDALVFLFSGKCLVCYRCRSEFRQVPIRSDHPGYDLAVGEKYRPVRQQRSEG